MHLSNVSSKRETQYPFFSMVRCILAVVFFKVLLLTSFADATLTEKITENSLWDGVAAYIAVNRNVIQDKLDAWHNSISDECEGPRLYLPRSPVFPEILDKNQHVLYIDAGYVDFYDFQELRDESVSIDGMEFAVTIPFLTEHPDGFPHYSLALSNFYERGRGDIPKPNIAFPYLPVDEITTKDNSVIVRNGSEEIHLTFRRHTDPCEPVDPKVRLEFDEYVDQDLQFGVTEPDFSFCDRHPVENRYCVMSQSIKCKLHRSSPNICQTSWKTPSRVSCDTPVQIVKVTPGFRDMMLLGAGEIEVIATESYFGNFSLGLKYPCIE